MLHLNTKPMEWLRPDVEDVYNIAEQNGFAPTIEDIVAISGLCRHTHPGDDDEGLNRLHILHPSNEVNTHNRTHLEEMHELWVVVRKKFPNIDPQDAD